MHYCRNSILLIILVIVALLLPSVGCHDSDQTQEVENPVSQPLGLEETFEEIPSLNVVESNIAVEETGHRWASSEIQLREPVSQITFIDQSKGWACNKGFVYKTIDSGKNWKPTPIGFIEQNDEINKIAFTDELRGWIVLQQNASRNEFSEKDKFRVFRTLDGGETWKLSIVVDSAQLSDFQASDNAVWIAANHFVGYHPQRFRPLMFHFSQKTNKWSDVSNGILRIYNDEIRYLENDKAALDYASVSLEKISIAKTNCVVAVTAKQSIIQSCDDGDNWKLINFHGRYGSRLNINQVNTVNNVVWSLEATGGIEGTGSRLVAVPLEPIGNAKLITIGGYFLTQGYWVSGDEFVAAGERVPTDVNSGENIKKDVVIRTLDGGRNWVEIYSSLMKTNRGTFFFSDSNVIWLIDGDGIVRRISNGLG